MKLLVANRDSVPINLRGVVVLTPSATRDHDEPVSSRSASTSAVGVVGARRRDDSLVLISCLLLQ
jgi:hypothetical protein